MKSQPEPSLACDSSAIPAAERSAHFALIAHLFGNRAREKRDVPNGYTFRFDADDLEEITRFVANERKCCPFLVFEIQVSQNRGPLWLRMTGPEGTHAFLAAELPI